MWLQLHMVRQSASLPCAEYPSVSVVIVVLTFSCLRTTPAMSIQTFQLGGVVLLALSLVAQTVVPNELIEKVDSTGKRSGGKRAAKNVVHRLMSWGFLLGGLLGSLQLVMLPLLQKSSPLPEVRQAAVIPCVLASVYQLMNGLVFIGEGQCY